MESSFAKHKLLVELEQQAQACHWSLRMDIYKIAWAPAINALKLIIYFPGQAWLVRKIYAILVFIDTQLLPCEQIFRSINARKDIG